MKPSSFALLFTALYCLSISCQHQPSIRGSSSFITAGVAGRVFDEAGLPLSNVQVQVEASNTTTDVNGSFTISDLQLNKEREVVVLNKSGYFKGIRTFTPTGNSMNHIEVKLIPKNVAGSFTASAGGVVNINSGGSISFPANSLVNATTNSPYDGTATVSAFFLDPTVSDFQKQLPGDLRGIDANDKIVGLQSLGMMVTEINGASGEKLQLATGTLATITLPIPAALNQQASATIPLWYLDENKGLWKQEGVANKSGTNYVGTVSHFTWWNCDYPYPMVQFTATIQDKQNHPLSGAHVELRASNGYTYGIADDDGKVAGKMPANESLTMYIKGRCTLDSVKFSPISSDHDFGILQSNATNGNIGVSISGHLLNCSGNAVTNGYVSISVDGNTYRTNSSNGNFSFSLQRCNNSPTSAQVVGYDVAVTKQSDPQNITVTSGNINVGNITACNSVNEYVSFSINGASYLIVPPYDSIGVQVQGMQTEIFTFNMDSTMNRGFDLGFLANTPGTYEIDLLEIVYGDREFMKPDATHMNVTVTEFGSLYQYIAGNFSGYIRDTLNHTDAPVNCTFRVRRD